jgi:hypothetical protein
MATTQATVEIPAAPGGAATRQLAAQLSEGLIAPDDPAYDEARKVWNPERRVVRAEAGATWGEVDRATQPHALAVPGGVVSTTGIPGLTLGGGLSWHSRRRSPGRARAGRRSGPTARM